MSDTYVALHPHVEDEEWPVHCVKPLEYGRSEFKNDQLALPQSPPETHWVSVPLSGSVVLHDLIPFVDIFTALYLGEQLLENLAALHRLGISYQDLTPSQVIIDHRFQLRLLPYPKITSAALGWSKSIMYQQQVRQVYTSPEQRSGGRGDSRSDLWSFGAIFYELLTQESLLEITS